MQIEFVPVTVLHCLHQFQAFQASHLNQNDRFFRKTSNGTLSSQMEIPNQNFRTFLVYKVNKQTKSSPLAGISPSLGILMGEGIK